tara:strand:+ start:244 stop:345 length:102 start_codon:yes stop_codon:yes gene_type:complete
MFAKILCGRIKNMSPHIFNNMKIVIWDFDEETK